MDQKIFFKEHEMLCENKFHIVNLQNENQKLQQAFMISF